MKKVFEEIGKGLISFANIVTALIFLKSYFDNSISSMLLYGIYFFITIYLLGAVLIKISERVENE